NLCLSRKVIYPHYHPMNLFILFDIIRKIRQFNPDIIHVQNGDLLSFLILLFLKKCSLITTIHDVCIHPGNESLMNRFIRFWSIKYSKKIFVHGKKLKEKIIREYNLPEDKVHSIPIGEHNVAPFNEYLKDNVKEEKYILFFGWIGIHKGLEFLIKAEPLISNEIPNVRIVIAGKLGNGKFDKEYFRKCQNLINNKQNFEIYLQYISWEFGAELFQKSSLVVLPYIETSQSGVIPTAYGFRKPVVVTDVGAMSEIVDDGITGFIVPPRNPEALADAIVKLLKDEKSRKRMGENAYKKLKTDLSWNNIAEKTIEVYNETIEDAKNTETCGDSQIIYHAVSKDEPPGK
ncbi:MAG: glycosyltransferase family 1 protein, partial [ANME-2 cluster archaeon]